MRRLNLRSWKAAAVLVVVAAGLTVAATGSFASSKAGVRTQDILLELNGKPVNVRFPEEVAPAKKMIADLPIGSEVTLKLKRGKDITDITAKTEKLQGSVGEEREIKTWGKNVYVKIPITNTKGESCLPLV